MYLRKVDISKNQWRSTGGLGTNYALHNVVQWSINRMHSFSSSKSVENGDQKILISHFIFCKNQRFHKILFEIGIQCQRIFLKTNSSLDSFVVESSKFQNFSIRDHSSITSAYFDLF